MVGSLWRAPLLAVVVAQLCLCVEDDDDSMLSLLQRESLVTRASLTKAQRQLKADGDANSTDNLTALLMQAISKLNASVPSAAFTTVAGASSSRLAEGGKKRWLQNTDPEAIKYLKSHTRTYVDCFTVALVVSLVAITSMGCCLGKRLWVPAMVIASYMVLIPGLFAKDFSFSIVILLRDYVVTLPIVESLGGLFPVDMIPERINVSQTFGDDGPIRESTRSLVKFLWDTGSHKGAVAVAIFAFVIPFMKLIFLGVAWRWQKHEDVQRVRMARHMIVFVQMISKWASPDMFAFALLYYLFYMLHHPPPIESLQVFDIGFVCYNVFCFSSVVSTLFLDLPELPRDGKEIEEESRAQEAAADFLHGLGGRIGLALVTLVNVIAWAVLFFWGCSEPILSLRLKPDMILKDISRAGMMPQQFVDMVTQFIDLDSIAAMVAADVSIFRASRTFWDLFFAHGELTVLLALLMLGVCCIIFTIVDMSALLIASCLAGDEQRFASRIVKFVSYFKHLAMVDVCLAGVVVVSFAGAVYEQSGILIHTQHGFWILLGAEVLHYATFYLVSWAVKALEPPTVPSKAEEQ